MTLQEVSAETMLRTEENTIVIPVLEEQLLLGKSVVESGGIRIIKTVSSHEQTVSEPTIHQSVQVDRITVNRILPAGDPLPSPRTEGDTYIIPIFEEILVLEKRVRVTEELHIRQERTETVAPERKITLRQEAIRIERIDNSDLLERVPSTTSTVAEENYNG